MIPAPMVYATVLVSHAPQINVRMPLAILLPDVFTWMWAVEIAMIITNVPQMISAPMVYATVLVSHAPQINVRMPLAVLLPDVFTRMWAVEVAMIITYVPQMIPAPMVYATVLVSHAPQINVRMPLAILLPDVFTLISMVLIVMMTMVVPQMIPAIMVYVPVWIFHALPRNVRMPLAFQLPEDVFTWISAAELAMMTIIVPRMILALMVYALVWISMVPFAVKVLLVFCPVDVLTAYVMPRAWSVRRIMFLRVTQINAYHPHANFILTQLVALVSITPLVEEFAMVLLVSPVIVVR
jgi:hypothetical protein